MPSSKSSRQKQARLSFTPLPSSSPASKGYHKQIRDRAAAVTLEDAPRSSKYRRVNEDDSDLEVLPPDEQAAIPTPDASVEKPSDVEEIDSDDQPIRPTQRTKTRVKTRSRQQKLDFSSSRDPDSFDSPGRLPSSSIRRRPSKPGMFSSQANGRPFDTSSDDDSDPSDALPSPRKLSRRSKPAEEKKSVELPVDDDEEDEIAVAPRRGRKVQQDVMSSPGKLSRRSKRAEEKKSAKLPVDVDEDDEIGVARSVSGSLVQDDVVSADTHGVQTALDSMERLAAPRVSESERGRRRTRQVQQTAPESEDDDDDMPTTVGKKPRRRRSPSRDSFISDSPPPAQDSDDDIIVVGQRSKKRARQASESEEEDDDLPKTPGRRRLKRPRQMTQQEKEDLAEDLDFLEPSSKGEAPSSRPRGSQSAQKNARQQALEKLKKMRSSQLPQVEEDEDEDEDQGDDDEVQEQDELYDDDEDMVPGVARARHMFTRDEEDDDFVEEEDEEGPLGVPEGVPLEFTRYASMKSKELFEFAVEWMVQKKINPGFRMNDPIYDLTFKKLDDEVRGLAASKFTSSAWTADFTLALQARPEIAYERIDRNSAEHWLRDKCDACNRSGHPATYQIQFQGKPYNRNTLEPVTNDDDDDDEASDSSSDDQDETHDYEPDWDASGREIAPISTIWYVGKFCKSNAETAHSLSHWRHHLNGFVEDYLEGHGYCTAEQLLKRDRWSTKKRGKYANKVVDEMKSQGEVKQLWKLFKDNIDQARNSKQGRYAADSD